MSINTAIKDAGIKLGKRVVYTIDQENKTLTAVQKAELASYSNDYVLSTIKSRVVSTPTPPITPSTPTPSPPSGTTEVIFTENFSKPWSLKDGQKSPDGEWRCKFVSGGSAVVANGALTIQPRKAVGDGTASALILSTREYGDCEVSFKMTTLKQLKDNPEKWEVGWFMWHYNDDILPSGQEDKHHHYYAYQMFQGGPEVGGKDYDLYPGGLINSQGKRIPGDQEHQQYLFTPDEAPPNTVKVKLEIGKEYQWKISLQGSRIRIWIDGNLQCDVVDDGKRGSDEADKSRPKPPPSPKMSKGHFAFYSEDAVVKYREFMVKQTK